MTHKRWLLVASFAAVSLVAGALLLDERQVESAVQSVQDTQIALATAVGADFETRLHVLEKDGTLHADTQVESLMPQLLGGALKLEQAESRTLLVARLDQDRLMTARGRGVQSMT